MDSPERCGPPRVAGIGSAPAGYGSDCRIDRVLAICHTGLGPIGARGENDTIPATGAPQNAS
jgi:hypothetical protein